MAHVKKYTRGALHNMLSHYDRTAKNNRENIDPSLTHLNYNLAEKYQPLPQKEFIDKRLSQVRVQKRKDVNVMCSWVLTVPKSLKPKEYERFFKAGYRFIITNSLNHHVGCEGNRVGEVVKWRRAVYDYTGVMSIVTTIRSLDNGTGTNSN